MIINFKNSLAAIDAARRIFKVNENTATKIDYGKCKLVIDDVGIVTYVEVIVKEE